MNKFKPSKYQQDIFDFIQNGKGSAVIEAVAGCLSGDTIVNFNRAGKGFKMSLKKAYERFNRVSKLPNSNWNGEIKTKVRSFKDSEARISLHGIQNIVESGIKKVIEVHLANGNTIKATGEHEFLTNVGWVKCKDLDSSFFVMCDTLKANSKDGPKRVRDQVIRGLKYHPYGAIDARGRAKRVAIHTLIFEANLNKMPLKKFVRILKTDEKLSGTLKFIITPEFEIHHKNGNHFDNRIENLECLTVEEHRKIHAKENVKNFNQGVPYFSRVVSTRPCGEEMTYDIVCENPHRNFVANGMVVHNSGKTTTCIEALKLIDEDKDVVFLAFNKSIADELRRRAPKHVDCMTTHSLGFRALKKSMSNLKVEKDKVREIVQEMSKQGIMTPDDYKYSSGHVVKLVSIAKANGLVPQEFTSGTSLLEDKIENWHWLLDYYGMDFGSPRMADWLIEKKTADIIGWARAALLQSCEDTGTIDFDDQLYMPTILNLDFNKYDFIFVDEAQDMSLIQRTILERLMGKKSRLIAVGDRKQVLYKFRGASADSLDQITSKFKCTTLPLSTSYRCGKKIIAEAQRFVPQIEHCDHAGEGVVERRERVYAKEIMPGDLVICRNKAPLIRMAYRLISNKVPAYILGRDIGTGLVTLIKKMKESDIDNLTAKLEAWRDKEIRKILKKDPAADVSIIDDKFDCINVFIDSCQPRTADELIGEIDKLFLEQEGAVMFSTIHKIKGREADKVWFANRHTIPNQWIKKADDLAIEDNIIYVGITRAKSHLVYFNSDLMVDGSPR